MSNSIQYRQADPADFADILSLQSKNLRQNLDEVQQRQGFLSVEYREPDLVAINASLGIFVAMEQEKLLAYAMAETNAFAAQIPLIAHMVSRFPNLALDERPLESFRYFIYGPVCIDRDARGRGLLSGLLQSMSGALSAQFDIGIAFISQVNIHSYHAHVRKNNMVVIDEFEFDGRKFWTVAFRLPDHLSKFT